MKIITKLNLGLGLLFLLITILTFVGTWYIHALKKDSEKILIANYNSLEYGRNMLQALDDNLETSISIFETHLQKQELNITEPGELETTMQIRNFINKFKIDKKVDEKNIRIEIYKLLKMNLKAIHKKNEQAKITADQAVFWVAITGALCFVIAFVLFINLPSNIANPIALLSRSIEQIAQGNYTERVHFESHNEYGSLAKSFNLMAEKLEEYNQSNLAKIMMQKKRMEALINHIQDPVIGLDEDLHVIFVNEQALKILTMQPIDLIGKSVLEISQKNDLLRTLTQNMLDKKNEKENPIRIYADNKESFFENETVPISILSSGESDPSTIGYLIFLRNITAYKELDFAKTNFIATLSHEFKTPISSIKLGLQLLENDKIGKLNEEQKKLLDGMNDDIQRLLKITAELLNMTQLETGNIHLSLVSSDPLEILHYAVHATQTQAAQKNIKIELDYPEKLSSIYADNEKTAWVLTNLISNAIRYSYENSIVNVTVTETRDQICFAVQDTGQGIDEEFKDKIFERYFRVPGTQKEGTGLGLSISKEFIEAQGGKIYVDSELGVGSTFKIVFFKKEMS